MPLFKKDELGFVRAISQLVRCNPFLPERIEAERAALGPEFVAAGPVWSAHADRKLEQANVVRITQRIEPLADSLRQRIAQGNRIKAEEATLYEDVVLYLLYDRYEDDLYRIIIDSGASTRRVGLYDRFLRDLEHHFVLDGELSVRKEPAHLFAVFFQIRRAFHFIFRNIIGGSLPVARLRAAVWQSIFTHDIGRYRRSLYPHMGDITTLIVGSSGTGKELVAQAIGLARYIPFDPVRQAFREDFLHSFYTLNLSALSPTLIESELFGHKRGAFTGAIADRTGWLDVCPPLGTVFLDEIAELEVSIQVKLLRVLQTRSFQRLGETKERRFHGKIIAATNRDLDVEMRTGRFREDLYYRLCADLIRTPSLEEQLRESPEDLRNLLLFISQRIAGETEADALAGDTYRWITTHLPRNYPWPGNVRELEQCVRNVMIRGEYHPPSSQPGSTRDELVASFLTGSFTADALLGTYCTLLYAQTGNYQETARHLKLDRRTVKGKIDSDLLDRLKKANEPQ